MAENLQSSQVIAKIFGVSTRRVEQLKTEGVIKGQGKPTKYDLLPTIQAYIKYLSDKANGREKKETDAQLETEKLTAEKRIKMAKAEMAELELKEMRGELHRASDVEAITTDHVLYLRSMLMALPGKLAVDVAAINSAPECADRIKREINSVLDSLANYHYDPDEYKKRVRERQGWNDRHGDEGDE
jgi:phage terminase Nu1 subunit (DNA packaging protein)